MLGIALRRGASCRAMLQCHARQHSHNHAFALGESWIGALGYDAALEQAAASTEAARTARPIEAVLGVPVRALDCGWGHSAVLAEDGTVTLFGRHDDFKNTLKHINARPFRGLQGLMRRLTRRLFPEESAPQRLVCPDPSDTFTGLACSVGALTALTTQAGRVYMCGQNFYGQCGIGSSEPAILYSPAAPVRSLDGVGSEAGPVVAVSCGFEHVLAVTASGALYAWGRGDRGQLGCGDRDALMAPARVLGPRACFLDEAVVAVDAGISQSAAITASGRLYVWGKMQGLLPKTAAAAAAAAAASGPDPQTLADQGDPAAACAAAYAHLHGTGGGSAEIMADQLVPRRVWVPPLLPALEVASNSGSSSAGAEVAACTAAVEPRVAGVTMGQAHCSFVTDDGRLWLMGLRGRGRQFDDSVARLERERQGLRATEGSARGALPTAPAQPSPEPAGEKAVEAAAQAAARFAAAAALDVPLPDTYMQVAPMPVPLGPLAGRRITRLRSDANYSYAVTEDGAVWRWGWRGIVLRLPAEVAGLRVADVAFGHSHALALAQLPPVPPSLLGLGTHVPALPPPAAAEAAIGVGGGGVA